MLHWQLAFPFFAVDLSLYSIRKFAYIMLREPGRLLRINSMAFIRSQPRWTRARATSSGARPSPATQCAPIRGGLGSPGLLESRRCFLPFSRLGFSSEAVAGLVAKNSSTMPNHLSMIACSGSIPSGKTNSLTLMFALSSIPSS